jgi:hypothetical protein
VLSYFKSQQPAAIVLFILLFGMLKLSFLPGQPVLDIVPAEGGWFRAGSFFADSPRASFFAAQVCLLAQAVWFNYLFHKADFHESNTMLPAVYFSMVTSVLPVFNFFSIYHLLIFLFLLLFRVLLQINSMESASAESYNAGFITGLLILLMPGMVLFLPFLFVILYILKSFRISEFILLLAGVGTPLYLAAGIGYLFDLNWHPSIYWSALFYPFEPVSNLYDTILLLVSATYLLFSFISLRGILFSVGFKRRKNVNMIVWLFLGLALVAAGNGKMGLPVLALLCLPVGTFLALLILRARRKKVPEILHTVFVLTIFIINILRLVR